MEIEIEIEIEKQLWFLNSLKYIKSINLVFFKYLKFAIIKLLIQYGIFFKFIWWKKKNTIYLKF